MTDTNEKLRALFLTALMVFSVFAGTVAFSGAAAADVAYAGTPDDVGVGSDSITQEITDIELDSDGDINVSLDPLTDNGVSLDDAEVSVNDNEGDESAELQSDGNVTISDADDGNSVDLELTDLNTTGASPASDLQYTVYEVGTSNSETTESFDLRGVVTDNTIADGERTLVNNGSDFEDVEETLEPQEQTIGINVVEGAEDQSVTLDLSDSNDTVDITNADELEDDVELSGDDVTDRDYDWNDEDGELTITFDADHNDGVVSEDVTVDVDLDGTEHEVDDTTRLTHTASD
ncbi:MAG: surface glycoprotein, partial [Halorhabdus sp.]